MRRKDREIVEKKEIVDALSQGRIAFIGLISEGKPYVIPMNYGFEYDENLVIYLHSAKQGKKIEAIKNNPAVCISIVPYCSLLSSEVACNYTMEYFSVVIEGKASVVSDQKQKERALNVILTQQTGIEQTYEYSANSISAVEVIEVKATNISAKANRSKG